MSTSNVFAYAPYVIGNADVEVGMNITTPDTSEMVVHTLRLPPATLKSYGDRLIGKVIVYCAATANQKSIRVRAGGLTGTDLLNWGPASNNGFLDLNWMIIRGATPGIATVYRLPSTAIAAFSGAVRTNPAVDLDLAQEFVVTLRTSIIAGDATVHAVYYDAMVKV